MRIHRCALHVGATVPRGLGAACIAAALLAAPTARAGIDFGATPLYLTSGKANVLIVLDNSNSMDEAPTGEAAGSHSAHSKSEIARQVVRGLVQTHRDRVHMGLMAYKTDTPVEMHLHNSLYDVSYSPSNYQPDVRCHRADPHCKRFRTPNPADPGHHVHYNVALPFYAQSKQQAAFCHSQTANAAPNAQYPAGFNNGEAATKQWDEYRCFRKKMGSSDTAPKWKDFASEGSVGYQQYIGPFVLTPTDSDYAQGLMDFGKRLTWQWVARTWYANDSPGRGYLHVPIKTLDDAQAGAILKKLACNVPGSAAGCTSEGIRNAGLTPIEGTLLTARDYYRGAAGGWNDSSEGYTSDCYPLPNSCGKNFVILLTDGLPSTDRNGAALTDPDQAVQAASNAAKELQIAGVTTYVIGFALPYGVDPATLDRIATAGGTGSAYNASDTTGLETAFKAIFDDIYRRTSSFSAMAQNSTALTLDSLVFQGRFDSTDWSGELVASRPEASGALTTRWSSSDAGNIPAASARQVFTFVPGQGGKEFKLLSSLSTQQQASLVTPDCSATLTGDPCAQARIDWLRGDRSLEEPSGPLRRRNRVLGDIISSSPVYVKESDTVFVGSNDGMLHAFAASTGKELFAFIPNAVVPRLHSLTDPKYAHAYFVDGEIAVSTRSQTSGRNILVGALGRGGASLYALDVTQPSAFGAAQVLWEFSDPDLGLVLGRPLIARLNNGRTGVIVGNGYNSSSERAVLFVIDIENGALIRKIDTGVGGPTATNGLATPRGWDRDANQSVDTVYAGDLHGNLWKFDLSASSPSAWGPAFSNGGVAQPLFVAKDETGKPQPITGGVDLGINPRQGHPHYGKLFVFFGTGRYFTPSDVGDLSVQSWYGIVDEGAVIGDRAVQLKQRTLAAEGTSAGFAVRTFSKPALNDMAGTRGWFLDWKTAAGAATGERVITDSQFKGHVLLVASIIPSTDVCVPGGSGFVNAIDPFTGAGLVDHYFDLNGDRRFDGADELAGDPVGSFDPKLNLPGKVTVLDFRLVTPGTQAGPPPPVAVRTRRTGRLGWRELVQ